MARRDRQRQYRAGRGEWTSLCGEQQTADDFRPRRASVCRARRRRGPAGGDRYASRCNHRGPTNMPTDRVLTLRTRTGQSREFVQFQALRREQTGVLVWERLHGPRDPPCDERCMRRPSREPRLRAFGPRIADHRSGSRRERTAAWRGEFMPGLAPDICRTF